MRYRMLSADGDYTFGQGSANYFANDPEAVAQAVLTRLLLITGEWFLDETEGTPYESDILGKGTQATYDVAIRQRILQTQGVNGILSYTSNVDSQRKLTVEATIDTIYGASAAVGPIVIPVGPTELTTESGLIITTEGGTPLIT